MLRRIHFHAGDASYSVVDAWSFRRSPPKRDERLLHIPCLEARTALEDLARHDAPAFRALCRACFDENDEAGAYRLPFGAPGPQGLSGDGGVERLLELMGYGVWDGSPGGGSDRASIYLLRRAESTQRPSAPPAPEEIRRIDRALRQLDDAPLILRGESYRFTRVGAGRVGLAAEAYETLSERQLLDVLSLLCAEPQRAAPAKAALEELRAVTELQQQHPGGTSLLLLRRIRSRVRTVEDSAPPITPSQLKREQHWIEILALDPRERPVSGVRLQLLLPDGSSQQRSTNDEGFARVDGIPAGQVRVRVLDLDGSLWKPRDGAGAAPAEADAPSVSHVVQRGDSLARLARRHRLKSWKQIWDHAENEELRAQREHPNRIRAGDVVRVPKPRVHEIERSTDATHSIEVERPRAVVALLNAHLVADAAQVDAHSQEPTTKLSASAALHKEDTAQTVRFHDLPHTARVVLVAPSGQG